MSKDPTKILEEALRLPPEARAALAGTLIESLEETIDAEAESEWKAEIIKRISELESEQVKSIPWSQARREILGR
ncbi:addiction module protein [Acidobacteriota bacterium]